MRWLQSSRVDEVSGMGRRVGNFGREGRPDSACERNSSRVSRILHGKIIGSSSWSTMRWPNFVGSGACELQLVSRCGMCFCSLASDGPQLYGQVGGGRLCGEAKDRVLGAHKQPGVSTSVLHKTKSEFASTSKYGRSGCDTFQFPSTVCHSFLE